MSAWRRLSEALEEGPPLRPVAPGVRTAMASTNQPITLTIGKKQYSFSVDEFKEMMDSGQLGQLVSSGQVRKLPGVG